MKTCSLGECDRRYVTFSMVTRVDADAEKNGNENGNDDNVNNVIIVVFVVIDYDVVHNEENDAHYDYDDDD